MDLAGQPLALGEHTGRVLGQGEVGAGGRELLDQPAAPFALAVQRLVAPDHGDGDGGAERGTDRHGRAEGAGVGGVPGDGRGGGDGHGGEAGAARQQVELEEVQREGQPHRLGGQAQQRQPDGAHGGQPPGGGPPHETDAGQQGTRRIYQAAHHRDGGDRSGVGAAVRQGPDGDQAEQADDQQVQAPGQGPGGRGRGGGRGGGVHSAFQATEGGCPAASVESYKPRAAFRPAKCRPAPDAREGGRRRRWGRTASTAGKDGPGPCSSPGETSGSPRGASP